MLIILSSRNLKLNLKCRLLVYGALEFLIKLPSLRGKLFRTRFDLHHSQKAIRKITFKLQYQFNLLRIPTTSRYWALWLAKWNKIKVISETAAPKKLCLYSGWSINTYLRKHLVIKHLISNHWEKTISCFKTVRLAL